MTNALQVASQNSYRWQATFLHGRRRVTAVLSAAARAAAKVEAAEPRKWAVRWSTNGFGWQVMLQAIGRVPTFVAEPAQRGTKQRGSSQYLRTCRGQIAAQYGTDRGAEFGFIPIVEHSAAANTLHSAGRALKQAFRLYPQK